MKRRDLLAAILSTLAADALPGTDKQAFKSAFQKSDKNTSRARLGPPPGELPFASALRAAEAIRRKEISSVELTQRIFERIDQLNPRINAFAYQLRDEALSLARKADEAQARGKSLGVFHGVPIHVKESFAVAGHPCTWGLEGFKNSKAPKNSDVVDRLLNAGAVLIGATNVPVALHDWQSYNSIYGTTNNPWDLKRTPGGSSGGSAASLAAGLGYLSVGSDIGGSIRVPSHFCGIYGHKPTLDLVSQRGHLPGGAQDNPGFSTLLAAAGPMARSAGDLMAALKVLGGPVGWDAKAWKWNLPPPRAKILKDYRVGYVLDDTVTPPSPEVKAVLEKVIDKLEQTGTRLKPGWPAGVQFSELLKNYRYLLDAFFFSVAPAEQQETQRKQHTSTPGGEVPPGLRPFADWQRQNFRRLEFRAQWQAYFKEFDVFLSPVAFSAAFPHDHSEPSDKRTIRTSSGLRAYEDMLNWIAPATLTGCPATVAPAGQTADGLPVGIQIMGPYWEDATPIAFAELLGSEVCGFSIPPGYYE